MSREVLDAWTGEKLALDDEYQRIHEDFCNRVETVWRWYAQMGYRKPPRRELRRNFQNLPPEQLQCINCGQHFYYPSPPPPPGKRGLLCGRKECAELFGLVQVAKQHPTCPGADYVLKRYYAHWESVKGLPAPESKVLIDVEVKIGELGPPRKWVCALCHTPVYPDQKDCRICGGDLTTGYWDIHTFDIPCLTTAVAAQALEDMETQEDAKFMAGLFPKENP